MANVNGRLVFVVDGRATVATANLVQNITEPPLSHLMHLPWGPAAAWERIADDPRGQTQWSLRDDFAAPLWNVPEAPVFYNDARLYVLPLSLIDLDGDGPYGWRATPPKDVEFWASTTAALPPLPTTATTNPPTNSSGIVPANTFYAPNPPSDNGLTQPIAQNSATSLPAPAATKQKDPKLPWDYPKRCVLQILFDLPLKPKVRQAIFNEIYGEEIAHLNFDGPFPYSRMSKQNAEKNRKDRAPHADWLQIVAPAADDADRAVRSACRAKVEAAALALQIPLDG